jgi:hypothetical protein
MTPSYIIKLVFLAAVAIIIWYILISNRKNKDEES